MKRFLGLNNDRILGVLTGFDRIVFRGTLRNISYVDGMGKLLGHHRIRYTQFGDFAQGISERLRLCARRYAKEQGRPYKHLDSPKISKEERACEIRDRDGIKEGLICVSLQGFRNKDIRRVLYGDDADEANRKKASGRVTRLLALLRSHKLIKKVSHTLYYRVTNLGYQVMSTALRLRNLDVAVIGS